MQLSNHYGLILEWTLYVAFMYTSSTFDLIQVQVMSGDNGCLKSAVQTLSLLVYNMIMVYGVDIMFLLNVK